MAVKELVKEVEQVAEATPKKKKVIRKVSPKLQISIPTEFAEYYGINAGEQVSILLTNTGMLVKPYQEPTDELTEGILKELGEEGITGNDLLTEFRRRKEAFLTNLNESTNDTLENGKRYSSVAEIDELFGTDEDEE